MYRKLSCLVVLSVSCFAATSDSNQESEVRDLIGRWDTAYRSLDAKAVAALETSDFELINRFGQWTPMTSRQENERMWTWGFETIYRGKPGPQHKIERVHFLSSELALVQAGASWPAFKLHDGTPIPAHGEIVTFVVVKQPDGWRIASQNIHNQMPGDELPAELPWNQKR